MRLSQLRWIRISLLAAAVGGFAVPTGWSQVAGVPSNEAVEETQPREGGWTHRVESDLIGEKFDELDRMADKYRREKTRVPGGDWRLRLFYTALDAPQLTDKDTVEHLAHLEAWMKARPESITARVALATSLHRWAWVARGNGEVRTVTPEGWRLFNERIKRSYAVLQGAADMKTMCPQWYSEMMTVGLAQSWDERRVRENFERGIQFEPGYFYLYRQFANYLLPKWDGKPGDASTFAKNSADRVGGDGGDQLYFQIATVLISRHDGDFPVKELDWQRIQRGAQVVEAQYGSTRKIRNELALMAYKYKDVAVARQQFGLIGDEWSRGVWLDRKFFDRARDWSTGHTS